MRLISAEGNDGGLSDLSLGVSNADSLKRKRPSESLEKGEFGAEKERERRGECFLLEQRFLSCCSVLVFFFFVRFFCFFFLESLFNQWKVPTILVFHAWVGAIVGMAWSGA
jgi:hypothetical protein